MSATRRLLLLLLLCALPLQGAVAASRLCLAMLAVPAPAATSAAPKAHADGHDRHAGAHGAHAHPQDAPAGGPGEAQVSDTCSQCAACCLTAAVAPQAAGLPLPGPAHAGFAPVPVPDVANVAGGLERPPRTV